MLSLSVYIDLLLFEYISIIVDFLSVVTPFGEKNQSHENNNAPLPKE
jgi:hypothetical protein